MINLGPPTKAELRGRIRKIVVEQSGVDPTTLNGQTRIDEMGWDVVGRLELMMAIEDAFDLEMPEAAADSLHTLQDIVDYVADRLAI